MPSDHKIHSQQELGETLVIDCLFLSKLIDLLVHSNNLFLKKLIFFKNICKQFYCCKALRSAKFDLWYFCKVQTVIRDSIELNIQAMMF